MDDLRNTALDRFHERLLAHVRQRFPTRTSRESDEQISAALRQGQQMAAAYGIVLENDIRRFIEYFVIYGRRCDAAEQTQWIGDILKRTDLDGTQKMDVIDALELRRMRGKR